MALDAYCRVKACGSGPGSQSLDEFVTDLLTDLRHYASHHKLDFEYALRLSDCHFEEEAFAGT